MSAERRPLPQRRSAENFEIYHNGHRAVVTIGRYDDSAIGEVFITATRVGSELAATARDGAVLISIALQYGVPLEVIQHALTRDSDGTASTMVGAVVDRIVDNYCAGAPPVVSLPDSDWKGPALEVPMDEIAWTTRTHNVLVRDMGLKTLGDITKYTKKDLMCRNHFGEKCLAEVVEVLAGVGLKLAGGGLNMDLL